MIVFVISTIYTIIDAIVMLLRRDLYTPSRTKGVISALFSLACVISTIYLFKWWSLLIFLTIPVGTLMASVFTSFLIHKLKDESSWFNTLSSKVNIPMDILP